MSHNKESLYPGFCRQRQFGIDVVARHLNGRASRDSRVTTEDGALLEFNELGRIWLSSHRC
jgi:hypothetical protein